MTKLPEEFKVLGVNCGIGVALLPFKSNLIGAIETRSVFHTRDNEQWLANFPDIPLYKKLNSSLLEQIALNRPNLIISSPDCGSGSKFRYSRAKTLGDHKKNDSLLQFLMVVNLYYPEFFLLENLGTMFKSFPEELLKDQLKSYRLTKKVLTMDYFGNSQVNRERLVIVGIRKDLPKTIKFVFPKKVIPHKTCDELYGDLGEKSRRKIAHVREKLSDVISIHAQRKLSLKEIKQEWDTRLKNKKRWESPGYNFTTAPGVYRNLHNSFPATARKANRQFDHHGLTLSPRQLARIMGVPDRFKLYIGTEKLNYWINKARTCVTKGMCYEVSLWLKKCLIKNQTIWKNLSK